MKLVSAVYKSDVEATFLYFDDGTVLQETIDVSFREYWKRVPDYPTSHTEIEEQEYKETEEKEG